MGHYLMLGVGKPDAAGRRSLRGVSEDPNVFVRNDLPVFGVTEANFFVTVPQSNKGIQCRFGMRGVIAEAHYDGGRNMVAMLKGNKRYILAPPRACKGLQIIAEREHPSYRHS